MKKLLFTMLMVFAVVFLKAEVPPTILFNEAFGPQGSWGNYTGAANEYTNWTDNRAGHTADPIQINNWKQSAGYDGASADMAFQSRWAAYSFTFTDVDIEGYENLKISFGLYWDSWFAAGYKPKIEVRVDGGNWVLLADADEPWPTPETQVENVWKNMTISAGIPTGNKLDIKFSTHSDPQNMCIDDVKLTGVLKNGDDPEPAVTEWHFETDGDAESWAGIGTTVVSVQNGALKTVVDHWEGPKISITGLEIDAEEYNFIEIALKVNAFAGSETKNVRAFFNVPDPARLVNQTYTVDADNYVIVELDMGAHALWTGTITQLRLDICYGGGQDVDVDYIKFKSAPVITQYSLTVNIEGQGSVEVDEVAYTTMVTVNEGTVLNIKALADEGFVFDGWSGDLTSYNAEEAVTMDDNKTITATFSPVPVFNVFAWEFETDGDSEGWAGVGTATVITVEDGHLKAVHDIALDNEGPKIINTGLQLAAADFTHAEIKMKTVDWTGEGKQLRFFWGREDSPNLGGDKLIVVGGITPDADIYQTITVDLNHAEWKGTVSTIRFDLLQWNGKEVHVDYIKLIGPAKMPPTARLQLIHNAADLAAANVDVFVNGEIFKEDFAFRTASPFENVPAGVDLTIDIAPADAGIEGSVFQTTVNLLEDEAYIVVANGIVSAEGYDPVEPFAVYPYTPAREAAVKSDETDLLVFHGATDAPTVSVWVMDGENELFNFHYGEFEGYLSLPTDNYALEVRTEDGSQVVATYSVPLVSLNLEGAALTVLASGFLNPAVNSDGPAFGLFVATAAGGDLLPLPLYVPPFDYTALLMDFELPLGTDGYDVESTWGQIEHGVVDNPAQVGINTSDKVYKSHREAGNWNSGIKFVFDSDVDDLGETNIRVKIHPVDRALNHVYFKFYDENDVVVSEGWHSTGSLAAGEWSYAVYSKDISGITFRKLDLNFSDEWGNTTSESTVYFDDLELFTPQYTLTVNIVGEGEVQVGGVVYSDPVTVDAGTELVLKAIADEGYQFVAWSGGLVSTNAEATLKMDGNKTVTATFSVIPPVKYTLTLVAEPDGAGTLTGAGDYAEGASVEITATAADNYVFVKWALEDGTEVSNTASFTYTMPAAAATLKAHFQSTVGVGEFSSENLTLYPNPATDFVKISLGSGIQKVYISDLSARIVYFNNSVNSKELNISTSQFETGVYLIRIFSNDSVITRKLQIVK
jgi:uncharacterized repeat protein (TIGR02543 family)